MLYSIEYFFIIFSSEATALMSVRLSGTLRRKCNFLDPNIEKWRIVSMHILSFRIIYSMNILFVGQATQEINV